MNYFPTMEFSTSLNLGEEKTLVGQTASMALTSPAHPFCLGVKTCGEETAPSCSFPWETGPGSRRTGAPDKGPFLTYGGLGCLAPSALAKKVAAAAREGGRPGALLGAASWKWSPKELVIPDMNSLSHFAPSDLA